MGAIKPLSDLLRQLGVALPDWVTLFLSKPDFVAIIALVRSLTNSATSPKSSSPLPVVATAEHTTRC